MSTSKFPHHNCTLARNYVPILVPPPPPVQCCIRCRCADSLRGVKSVRSVNSAPLEPLQHVEMSPKTNISGPTLNRGVRGAFSPVACYHPPGGQPEDQGVSRRRRRMKAVRVPQPLNWAESDFLFRYITDAAMLWPGYRRIFCQLRHPAETERPGRASQP